MKKNRPNNRGAFSIRIPYPPKEFLPSDFSLTLQQAGNLLFCTLVTCARPCTEWQYYCTTGYCLRIYAQRNKNVILLKQLLVYLRTGFVVACGGRIVRVALSK